MSIASSSRPRGPNGQFLPKPWPLDQNGKPKREALAEHDPIAVAHREEKPYSKEAKEERRKVSAEESGKRDAATGQLKGGIPGHEGAFGRVPADLRERLRGSAAERIKVLEQIADNPKTTPRDRMQAIDLLFRYGLGPVTSHDVSVDHSFSGLFTALSQMPPEHLKRLEDMNDEQLSQTLNFMLGNGRDEAAAELTRKLNRMMEAREIEARTEAPPPRKALPKPRKAEPSPSRTAQRKLSPSSMTAVCRRRPRSRPKRWNRSPRTLYLSPLGRHGAVRSSPASRCGTGSFRVTPVPAR